MNDKETKEQDCQEKTSKKVRTYNTIREQNIHMIASL